MHNFQGCTAALTGLPPHMPNRKHYRVCWVYRFGRPSAHHPNLFSVSLYFYIHLSSPSRPWPLWLSITEALFPVSSNFLQCLCLSHPLQSLWRTIQFLVLTHMSSPSSSPLTLFSLSSIHPASWSGSKSEWFSWDSPLQKKTGAVDSELPVIIWADISSQIRAD